MHWAKITSVLLAATILSNTAVAEDGVMVDLSVLNSLGNDYYEEPEPLFPVLPKRNYSKPKTTKAKAIVKSPTKNKKSESVAGAAKPVEKKTEPIAENVVKPLDEKVIVVDVEPASAPVVPVDVEPLSEPVAAPMVDNSLIQNNATEKNTAMQNLKVANENDITNTTIGQDNTNKAEEAAATITVDAPSEKIEPLIDTLATENKPNGEVAPMPVSTAAEMAANANSVKFGEDIDELNAEMEQRIDEIVKDFSNDRNAKIAIYAYNLDDGVDSFRKKRISLNRAIEVRSYLLRKGFKNFSIKVVNISGNSAKLDTVELEEI